MLSFYNDPVLAFIGRGPPYLLQHILTTKVDVEDIPNTRLRSLKSKWHEIVRYIALGLTINTKI